MKTFRYWFRPTLLVLLWMVAAAFTLAELATVPPVLASLAGEPTDVHELGGRPLRARTYAANRRGYAP